MGESGCQNRIQRPKKHRKWSYSSIVYFKFFFCNTVLLIAFYIHLHKNVGDRSLAVKYKPLLISGYKVQLVTKYQINENVRKQRLKFIDFTFHKCKYLTGGYYSQMCRKNSYKLGFEWLSLVSVHSIQQGSAVKAHRDGSDKKWANLKASEVEK